MFIGVAPEYVNRQLQFWRKDGILDLRCGRILLQNMSKLATVAWKEQGGGRENPRPCVSNPHVRDYSVAGHMADIGKSTRMTRSEHPR